MTENVAGDEPYVLVEDVAERLGLPLAVLLRRVEAGDIPARRVETEEGVRYALRLGDLGVEADDDGMTGSASDGEDAPPASLDEPQQVPLESGIVYRPDPGTTTPPWAARRREPQQPPPWIVEAEEPEIGTDADAVVAERVVPPPGGPPLGLMDAGLPGPRGDLASMSLDARELVAGLLDRWERTLELRIYAEQRQRFQAELVSGQGMVKQLQMELQAARAEHAAAQAQKDRELARKERELADRERDLAEARRATGPGRSPAAALRRRGWFRRRDV